MMLKQLQILISLALIALIPPPAMGGGDYCYSDEDGCGPNTPAWPKLCHTGECQSPICLPPNVNPSTAFYLRIMNTYKGDFFRMQNSGHSLYIDFVGESGENEGPSAQPIPFPDATHVDQPTNVRHYKFVAAHFHWGPNDKSGSEHCIGNSCAAMEVHFVHYWTKYNNTEEAFHSGDPDALAVIGGLINTTAPTQAPPAYGVPPPNIGGPAAQSPLDPIVKHLGEVTHPGGFIRVDEALDLTELIGASSPSQYYSYKGSLTTPGCQEQVNWFVRKPASNVPQSNLEEFRTKLKDSHGKLLKNNHRPLQEANGRKIVFSNVFPTSV